jgi:hypothetical protein
LNERRWGAVVALASPACLDAEPCTWAAPVARELELGPHAGADLHAIDGPLVVGDGGLLLGNADAAWEVLEPAGDLRAISRCPATDCFDYIVGEQGAAFSGENTGWAPLELGTTRDLFDVAAVDGQVIVVGDEVLRVWNEFEGPGVAFDPVPPDPAGWGVLRDYASGVVVGDGGVIYESEDLHEWVAASSGTTEDLLALGFVDVDPEDAEPAQLWAVGRGGVVLVRGADGWARRDYGLDDDLLDVDAGFVITSGRAVLRLDPSDASSDGVEEVAVLDRQPLALEAGYFAAAEPSIEVVGEAGLDVTISRCE